MSLCLTDVPIRMPTKNLSLVLRIEGAEHDLFVAQYSDASSETLECFNCCSKNLTCLVYFTSTEDELLPPFPHGINIEVYHSTIRGVTGICRDPDCIAFSKTMVSLDTMPPLILDECEGAVVCECGGMTGNSSPSDV